jgi:hypothetical protein
LLFILNGNGVPSIAKIVSLAAVVPNAPDAPSALSASAISSTRIDLTWSDNSVNEDGFTIERSTDGASFDEIVTLNANVTAYSDIGLAPATTYYYRIQSYNTGGTSSFSNTVNTTTPALAAPPPNIATISPNTGSGAGGTAITLNGSGFVSGATVLIGGFPAMNVNVANSTTITASTPAHVAGPVDVVVTNPDNQSGILPASRLDNPNFELGPANWKFGGKGSAIVKTDAANAHAGNNYAEMTATNANDNPKFQAADLGGVVRDFPVAPGNVIKYGGWINPVSGNGSSRYSITILDANKANQSTDSIAANTKGTWSYKERSYTVPTGKAYIRFYSQIYQSTQPSVARFDDALLSGGFTYTSSSPAPSVSSVSPATGSDAGGTSVTISGSGFLQGATVSFGTYSAINVAVAGSTSITAVTPSHPAGIVDVVVKNPDNQTGTRSGGFTFTASPGGAPPSITSVTPNSGPTSGGTEVSIAGSDFETEARVSFGGIPAATVVFTSSTALTATTSAHAAGVVDVVVTNPEENLSGTLPNGFTYSDNTTNAPTVAQISPSSGTTAGGTAVTLSGMGFQNGASVTIGGTPATAVSINSSTSVTATTPAHTAGAADVVVTNPDNQSGTLSGGYTYTVPAPAPAPTITAISPNSGKVIGGTVITITGSGFQNGAAVSFGGLQATSVNVTSPTSINATTPAHSAGVVDVVVTNPDNQQATLPANRLFNESFESGPNFWKFSGGGTAGVQANPANSHTGDKYAELSGATGDNPKYQAADAGGVVKDFPIKPGDLIKYGGWIFPVSGNGNSRYVLSVLDANKANQSVVSISAPTPGVWTYKEGSYVVPTGKAFLRFYSQIYQNTVPTVARFDDAFLSGGFIYVP